MSVRTYEEACGVVLRAMPNHEIREGRDLENGRTFPVYMFRRPEFAESDYEWTPFIIDANWFVEQVIPWARERFYITIRPPSPSAELWIVIVHLLAMRTGPSLIEAGMLALAEALEAQG